MTDSRKQHKVMISRLFSLIALTLLLTNASLASANQPGINPGGGTGSSWGNSFFGHGEQQEVEYEPLEMGLVAPPLSPQQRSQFNSQILQRLQIEKQRNAAVLSVQLAQPIDPVTLTTLTNNWKNMLAGVQIQIETFSPTPDRVMIRIINSNMVNDVKNMLLDDPKVALVTIEQQVFSGSAALQQQMLEFEAERLEQQQELAEEAMERQILARKAQMYGGAGFGNIGGVFGNGYMSQGGQNMQNPGF